MKNYVTDVEGQCYRLGFRLKITETPRDTMVLLSNPDSQRVAFATFSGDEYGAPRIRAFLVNKKRYQWALDEGFNLDQMIELEKEKVFIEFHPKKIGHYLI